MKSRRAGKFVPFVSTVRYHKQRKAKKGKKMRKKIKYFNNLKKTDQTNIFKHQQRQINKAFEIYELLAETQYVYLKEEKAKNKIGPIKVLYSEDIEKILSEFMGEKPLTKRTADILEEYEDFYKSIKKLADRIREIIE